jgi:mannan endo-1,4-beta-mannosidase
MQDKRVQAPRALWDGLYVEPSWVAGTEWANLGLLRRLNLLIGAYYPGTKLGLTEWNFGGDDDISGAMATADALGIFGRENLYCASYWGLPKQGSATGWAFRLYRNYDGQGATFGTESVDTQIDDTKTMSAYGALNQEGTKLTVMLINKDRTVSKDISIKASGFTPRSSGTVYTYSQQKHTEISQQPLLVTNPAAVKVTLAPMSINLVVLEK